MSLITDRKAPADVPTTNALDTLEDPDNPTPTREKAEIYLSGAHVATVENAPNGLERITMMVELEVTEEAHRFNDNGDTTIPIRRCRRIGDMWPVGTPKPQPREKPKSKAEKDAEAEAAAAENQPALYDDEPEAIGDLVDGVVPGVDRPGFSDADQ
jgi:hypothetical protein